MLLHKLFCTLQSSTQSPRTVVLGLLSPDCFTCLQATWHKVKKASALYRGLKRKREEQMSLLGMEGTDDSQIRSAPAAPANAHLVMSNKTVPARGLGIMRGVKLWQRLPQDDMADRLECS